VAGDLAEGGEDRDAPRFGRCVGQLGWLDKPKGEVFAVSFAEDPRCGFDGSGWSIIAAKMHPILDDRQTTRPGLIRRDSVRDRVGSRHIPRVRR
jgi:hypothetical protein